jgi:O-antigen ligase
MAFFFFMLYLSVIYLRPAEWVPFFHGWQLVDLTLIGAALFLMFQSAATKRGLVKVPHNGMILGLLGSIVASHAIHTYLGGIVGSFTAFAPVLIMYFLVVNTMKSEQQLKIGLWVIVLLTVLLAWQGIHQSEAGRGWAGQRMSSGGRITWIGIFNDPNDLALAFVIVVPVLFAFLVRPTFFALKILPLGLAALLIYGVFLTNSRGGALGLAVAVAFFFGKRSRWVIPGGIIGGSLAALIFAFGPSRLGLLAAQDESAMGRLDSWYYGFQLMKANPLFGVGHNMFTNDYPLTAHNSFVLAAAELGFVGLFCWVGLFYLSFKGLSLVQKHHARLAPYAYGLQASLVGFLATSFFLSRTYIEMPYLVCALSASLYYVASQQTDLVSLRVTGKEVGHVALLALGSLGMAQVAMKTWL